MIWINITLLLVRHIESLKRKNWLKNQPCKQMNRHYMKYYLHNVNWLIAEPERFYVWLGRRICVKVQMRVTNVHIHTVTRIRCINLLHTVHSCGHRIFHKPWRERDINASTLAYRIPAHRRKLTLPRSNRVLCIKRRIHLYNEKHSHSHGVVFLSTLWIYLYLSRGTVYIYTCKMCVFHGMILMCQSKRHCALRRRFAINIRAFWSRQQRRLDSWKVMIYLPRIVIMY